MRLFKFFTSSNRRVSLGLGVVKFFKAILSLYVIVLSAKFFGTSEERDIWILGGTVVSVLIQIIFGPINETFRVKYIHLREEFSIKEVNNATDSLITLTIIIGFVISIIIYLFPCLVTRMFAPGFTKENVKILEIMIKVLIPSLLVTQVTTFWSSMLNAYNSFYIPDLFSFVSLIINVLFLVVLAPLIGIYSLVISSYLSSALLIVVVYRELYIKFDYRFKIVKPQWKLIKPFFLFSIPLYVNYLFSQADIIIEKALTSKMVQGSISILDYAKKFTDLPVTVVIGVVTTVLTPVLALSYMKNNVLNMVEETQRYFRMLSLILIPLVTLFIVVPKEIVTLVLLRGAFKEDQVALTSEVLSWLGIGVFYTVIYVIYSQILIARKNIKVFSLIVIGTYVLKIIFNFMFYETYKLLTFPISWVLTQFIVSSLILWFGIVEFRKRIVIEVIKIHLILFFVIGINYFFYNSLLFYFKESIGIPTLLFLVSLTIIFSEILLIYVFRIEERDTITKYLSNYEQKNKNN